jgi:NlpC/P60 family putative phage cell wall peptidase
MDNILSAAAAVDDMPSQVVAAARSWLGTPYHDQASVRGVGCDCLGLARGVWRDVVGPEPFPIPPYSRNWGETGLREVLAEGARACMIEVEPSQAGAGGTLLLFRMVPRAIAKHVGILTEPERFIHAYERLGVIEEPLTQAWRRRIAFAFLFCKLQTEAGEGKRSRAPKKPVQSLCDRS